MRPPIGRHDARVVNDLGEQRDIAGALKDLQVLVVSTWIERRTGIEADEAADFEIRRSQVLEPATARRFFPRKSPPGFGKGVQTLLGLRRQRRHPSVGWIDNERRPLVILDAAWL